MEMFSSKEEIVIQDVKYPNCIKSQNKITLIKP